jgi:hypothetical protein
MNNLTEPKFAYDCKNCRFEWNCGYTCFCNYKRTKPEPPNNIKILVNQALISAGLDKEYTNPELLEQS